MLGDSLTGTDYAYWLSLQESTNVAFMCTGDLTVPTYINSGVNSNQSSNWLADVQTRVIDHEPTVLIMTGPVNDGHDNGVTPLPIQDTEDNLNGVLDACLLANPALKVLMVGPWIYGGTRPNGSNAYDTALDAINEVVGQIAAERGFGYVDVRSKYFTDTVGVSVVSTDGVHPEAAGATVGAGDRYLSAQVAGKILLDLS